MKRLIAGIILISFFLMGAATQEGTIHTVQSGDTLSRIAARYMPLTAAYTKRELIENIKSINNITGSLSLGQTLRIPVVWDQPLKPKIVAKPKSFTAKGLYMNPKSAGSRVILDTADRLKLSGGNTIVFDAKDDVGAITYRSTLQARYCPDEKYTPNIEELPKMIEYLHRKGIHVVARVVVLKDPIMSRVKPLWCINREKEWLDPANQEVQEYILAVIRDLSERGVDEIQLDYIRYFADGQTGAGTGNLQRTDVIALLLKKIHDITSPKGVLLSMDMFGIVIWQKDVDVLVVGQDITKMKPYVDIISPMLYPSHFNAGFGGVKNPADDPYRFVFNGIKRMKELVGDGVIIRPWLQAFPLRVTRGFGPDYIQKQINASIDAGGTGWLLWSPGNHYSDSFTAIQALPVPKQKGQDTSADARVKGLRKPASSQKTLPAGQPLGMIQPPASAQKRDGGS